MKIIRWLLFVLLSGIIIEGITQIFKLLILWILSQNWILFFFIVFGLGILILGLMFFISMLFSTIAVWLCPDYNIGATIFSILAILNGIYLTWQTWTVQEIYDFKIIVFSIIITFLIFELTISMIAGAVTGLEEN